MSATASTQINGGGMVLEKDQPIPKPSKIPKILDVHGDTLPPSAMTAKTPPDIIQVPRWAVGTFGTFILIVGFYAISFYNQTNNKIDNLTEKYNQLNNAQEEKRKLELQEMINSAVKRGYELKAAEGDHGKEKK